MQLCNILKNIKKKLILIHNVFYTSINKKGLIVYEIRTLILVGWTQPFAKQFDDNLKGNNALDECVGGQVQADIDILC